MMNKNKNKLLLLASFLCFSFLLSAFSVPAAKGEAAPSTEGKVLVSLGDSYSSGEGIEPFYGQYKPASEKVANYDWLAHRSEKSWPGMLTMPNVNGNMAKSENRNNYWFFAAASGATTEHLTKSQRKEYNKEGIKGSRDLPAQLDVFKQLGDKKADYVTVTIGGNDMGFSEIIKEAAVGSTYLDSNTLAKQISHKWKEFYAADGIRDDIKKAYKAIEEKAGDQARIIVVGYPTLLEENGKGAVINQDEAKLINDSVRRFNKELEVLVKQCKAEGMKICFVSVEDEFKGHEAYTDEPWINEIIIGAQPEELKDFQLASHYSIHPNEKGAEAYARCVQKKIDDIEKDNGRSEWPIYSTSGKRDIVLVLDVSGSMAGKPLEETKKASENFVKTILKEDASIGIVTYGSSANIACDFNRSENRLVDVAKNIRSGGGTDTESGLKQAEEMLKKSDAEKKIIVLMSDGEPNEGKVGNDLIAYADEIKASGTYIYTLGFFESMSGSSKSAAQMLMEEIATEGCHYEVANADDLVFFFGDIADQINGQKYIYVRIACPVDVSVSHNGETLDSSAKDLNTRTGFGTLTFEENTEEERYEGDDEDVDDRVKILRLKNGEQYDIKIEGTAKGKMNYTIGFMDDQGNYSDTREFENINITKTTEIATVAEVADTTTLKVDEDGDGKYEQVYKAKANGKGELVDYTYLFVIAGVVVALIALLIFIIKLRQSIKRVRAAGGFVS